MCRMASDYAIIEDELTKQLSQLKRDLHMKGVKSLSRKHYGLAKMAVQKKQIKVLKHEIEEMKPTVSMIYCPNNVLKDNEIKGYLIYLLQLKEYFAREVKTKQDIILQREEQIKKLVVKLCAMRNEYAKKKRSLPVKPVEFIQLDNMSNRMNQMEKRICALQHENKEIREKILDMRTFQTRYRAFEKGLRAKIKFMNEETQKHLDRAVATYEDREELVNKSKIYQERYDQDFRKAVMNQNALDQIREKIDTFEELFSLQNEVRSDSRVRLTAELIDKGVTGLEPTLKHLQDLHASIVASSGKETPEDIAVNFKLVEEQTGSVFSYLDELLKDIHHTQNTVNELKVKNAAFLKSLTIEERKMRWDIERNERKADESAQEAKDAVEIQRKARKELNALLENLKTLRLLCCSEKMETRRRVETKVEEDPDLSKIHFMEDMTEEKEEIKSSPNTDPFEDAQSSNYDSKEIDDSNALEFLEDIEKKILENLMLVEYLRIKDIPVDDIPAKLLTGEEDLQIIDSPKLDPLDTLQPRTLESQVDIIPSADLTQSGVMNLEQLKIRAKKMVSKIESGRNSDDEGSSHS